MPNAAQLALIHVAKKQLCLGDDEYGLILDSVCGVSSAKDIRTDADVKALMQAFQRLGFKQQAATNRPSKIAASGYPAATIKQIYLIETLWQKITKFPESWQATLDQFLARRFHVNSLNALNRRQAAAVIETFREMLMRSILCQCHAALKGGENVVENQLLDLYSKTSLEFTHEELITLMTALLYRDPDFSVKIYHALDLIRGKMPSIQSKDKE